MSERNVAPELQALYDADITVYSISRLDCINHCLYEAYRSYKLKQRGDDNIYSLLGTKVHDVLEQITNGSATEADLLPAMEQELIDADLFGYEFPKDSSGGDAIRNSWIADMTHFCNTYKRPNGKFKTEDFFLYKTPKGRYLQGYIDLQFIRDDGSVDVYDYKTSTKYSGEAIKEHGRQLITYAMGLEQKGIKVHSVNWIFLKYARVCFFGKKTTKSKDKIFLEKIIERKKIGAELSRYVDDDLIELGYNQVDRELYIGAFIASNSFDSLPPEVKERYNLHQCVCNYELTDEARNECVEYIDSTIDMWEKLGDSEVNYPPLQFEKTQKNGKVVPDIFYCTKLCGHSKHCNYLSEYLDTRVNQEEDEYNLF